MTVTPDARVQAAHVLAVLRAAQDLVAITTRAGGHALVDADAIREQLARLCETTGALAVYHARAVARGSVKELTDDRLAAAIEGLRREPSADEQELLEMTEHDVESAFDLAGAPDVELDGKDRFSL